MRGVWRCGHTHDLSCLFHLPNNLIFIFHGWVSEPAGDTISQDYFKYFTHMSLGNLFNHTVVKNAAFDALSDLVIYLFIYYRGEFS